MLPMVRTYIFKPAALPMVIGLALLFSCSTRLHAVIFASTGDSTFNTTAPTGPLANSGWQYQGQWGSFLGTPVSPNHFVTAKHIGGSIGDAFTYNGISYTTTAVHNNGTDLNVWEVSGTFSTYAPLYHSGNEAGKSAVIFGRGTQRGSEIIANNELKGWTWGVGDSQMRWGENTIEGGYGSLVKISFDLDGGPNEVHLSSGDSGGAIFVQEGGIWKLAAINYAVDGPWKYEIDGSTFNGAVFDRGGLYRGNTLYPDQPADNPSSFYATPISSNYEWLMGVALVPVPEPSTWALLVSGFGMLLWRWKRR